MNQTEIYVYFRKKESFISKSQSSKNMLHSKGIEN